MFGFNPHCSPTSGCGHSSPPNGRQQIAQRFIAGSRTRKIRIPTGFRPLARGCPGSGTTLGRLTHFYSTPTGLCPGAVPANGRNPVGIEAAIPQPLKWSARFTCHRKQRGTWFSGFHVEVNSSRFPFITGLGQDRTDEAQPGGFVWKEAGDAAVLGSLPLPSLRLTPKGARWGEARQITETDLHQRD